MSKSGLTVKILGKDYLINCPDGNEHQLMDASFYLNDKMNEIRNIGRVIGQERIAVMAALNIAHELLAQQASNENSAAKLAVKFGQLQAKVSEAVAKAQQLNQESIYAD